EQDELKLKKIIAGDELLTIGIFPITPQNIPNRYANHMLLALSSNIIVSSKSSVECYLIMPIEIGIAVNNTIIDVYSLGYTKYALYGIPERGIICRYYKSDVYTDIPKLEPLREAVVRCLLKNYTNDTKTISKIVYPIDGADLYYDNTDAYFDMLEVIFEKKLNTDILNVNVRDMEWNASKTNFSKPFNTSYVMEWGY
ncbi:MAG: DUF432 domain-containing protein, partial [Candidatus Nitrosothermus koennekii]